MNIYRDIEISYHDISLTDKPPLEHFHNSFELALFVQADLQIFINNTSYNIQNGDLFLINEYDIHRIVYTRNTQYIRYVINFKKEPFFNFLQHNKLDNIKNNLLKSNNKIARTGNLKTRSRVKALFENIYTLYTNYLSHNNKNLNCVSCKKKDKKFKSLLQANLLLILDNFFVLPKNEEKNIEDKNKIIKDIINYIDNNFDQNLRLEKLASKFNLSKYYISHLFQEISGFTVVEYIQKRRIISAQKMLKNTDKDITEIYLDCGFNNAQHFYRVFKRIAGITPAKYRNMN